jgi:tetratricopeptide (TPR) repeat protein
MLMLRCGSLSYGWLLFVSISTLLIQPGQLRGEPNDRGWIFLPAAVIELGSDTAQYGNSKRERFFFPFRIAANPVQRREFEPANSAVTIPPASPMIFDTITAANIKKAEDYCQTKGWQLATEDEWEAAALSSPAFTLPTMLELTASQGNGPPRSAGNTSFSGEIRRIFRGGAANTSRLEQLKKRSAITIAGTATPQPFTFRCMLLAPETSRRPKLAYISEAMAPIWSSRADYGRPAKSSRKSKEKMPSLPIGSEIHVVFADRDWLFIQDINLPERSYGWLQKKYTKSSFPDHSRLYQEGQQFFREKKWAEALTLFERCAALQPKNVAYLSALASLYEVRENHAEAERINRIIATINQDLERSRAALGKIIDPAVYDLLDEIPQDRLFLSLREKKPQLAFLLRHKISGEYAILVAEKGDLAEHRIIPLPASGYPRISSEEMAVLCDSQKPYHAAWYPFFQEKMLTRLCRPESLMQQVLLIGNESKDQILFWQNGQYLLESLQD